MVRYNSSGIEVAVVAVEPERFNQQAHEVQTIRSSAAAYLEG